MADAPPSTQTPQGQPALAEEDSSERRRQLRDAHDREIIERNAAALNRDAEEWLELVAAVNDES